MLRSMEQLTPPSSSSDESLAWVQSLPKEGQDRLHREWQRIQSNVKKMRFDRSPFIPTTFIEYVEHQREMKAIMEQEKAEKACAPLEDTPEAIALKKYLGNGPSGVEQMISTEQVYDRAIGLADVSIWAPTWQPTVHRPMAPWPSEQEFREEGDERHTSGFGRFLPVPRAPGRDNGNWKQRPFLPQSEMDRVRPVPKKCFGIQLPNDIEVWEPTMDDDGNYVDDEKESGRESFGDTSERRATRVLSREEDSSHFPFGSEMHWQHRGHKYPVSAFSPNMMRGESPSPPVAFPPAPTFEANEVANFGNSYGADLSTPSKGPTQGNSKVFAEKMLKGNLSSEKRISKFKNSLFSGGNADNVNIQWANKQQGPSYTQTAQKKNVAADNLGNTEEKPFHTMDPWRKISYGQNSFVQRDTNQEESPEELIESTFGKGRARSQGGAQSHGFVDPDLTPRAPPPSLVSRCESVSPMSLGNRVPENNSQSRDYRSNSFESIEQDFDNLGLGW